MKELMGDKKRALSIIIAGLGGKKSEKESEEKEYEEEEGESDEGLKAAADDILTAIAAKDSDMLSKALSDFVGMC
jgi:hypothetical protein